MIAHVVSGGSIINEIFSRSLGYVPSAIFYVILFFPVVYLGTRTVDRLNLIIFSGVLISYLLFIIVSATHIDVDKLTYIDWSKAWPAIPILFTAFTYQVIIPTLVTYMKKDFKKVRKSIFIGTSIPLGVYLIWQIVILGIIPIEGPNGLIAAAAKGENAVAPLKHFVDNPMVVWIGKAFAFFAMTASYIALGLAFLDFLADGLKIKKKGMRKLFLCTLVFGPPLIVSIINENIFLIALGYAGGISCAILFGLYPPLMAWIGRYKKGYKTGQQIPGGKGFLSFLMLLIMIELGLEILTHF